MIHSSPINPNHQIREKKTESGRPSSSASRFRELIRKRPKDNVAQDHKDRSSPSLFALIQQEKKDINSSYERADATCISPLAMKNNLIETETNVSKITSVTPWQTAILEHATHGIQHIVAEQMNETSFTLTGSMFADSPLAGVQVIIREYSTAPLSFNVHFICAPCALEYLQPHLKTLASLFQNRRYPFSIQSIGADLGDGVPSPIQREKNDDQQHEEERG